MFSSDHGDLLGGHGGMHEKWHNAYEESLHVPFVVAGAPIPAAGTVDIPTTHADLIPTLMGFTGIDQEAAREQLAQDHTDARPLVGRDLSSVVLAGAEHPSEPLFFMTDDEISEGGSGGGASPIAKIAKKIKTYHTVRQPSHLETVIAEVDVDGAPHLVKLSRYFDNAQFWTVAGEHDVRVHRRETATVTEPAPDEYEMYDLHADPLEQRNLAHPSFATDASRALQEHMLGLLVEQLAAKRLVPSAGAEAGYRPPAIA